MSHLNVLFSHLNFKLLRKFPVIMMAVQHRGPCAVWSNLRGCLDTEIYTAQASTDMSPKMNQCYTITLLNEHF